MGVAAQGTRELIAQSSLWVSFRHVISIISVFLFVHIQWIAERRKRSFVIGGNGVHLRLNDILVNSISKYNKKITCMHKHIAPLLTIASSH